MAKKVTIKEQFTEVAEVLRGVDRADLAEFIEGRIEVLNKKAENKKATAKQVENEGIKSNILERLSAITAEDNRSGVTVGELIKDFEGVSSQKMSALLRQLVESGKVNREVVKKVAYFSIA